MLSTRLQEQFGIRAGDNKTVPVPRILTAYGGKDKAEFLSVTICMIVNEVLPAHGWKRSSQTEMTQDELAAAMGLASRSSLTNRISRLRAVAADRHGQLKAGNLPVPMLNATRRRFSGPNVYTGVIPEKRGIEWVVYRKSTNRPVSKARFTGPDASAANLEALACAQRLDSQMGRNDHEVRACYLNPENFYYGSPKEILANESLAGQFDESLLLNEDGSANFSGTADIPKWLWHPSLGISDNARLVLNYYIMCGLLSDKAPKTGRLKGYVRPHQKTVARRVGISTKTVRRADRELESVGLIRKKGEVITLADGNTRRWVSTILFLPIRTMTDEEIAAERRRRVDARRALHETRKQLRRRLRLVQLEEADQLHLEQKRFNLALQACKAARIHRRVTESYEGQTARISALWTASRTKLLEAGIDQRLISALIPSILAPPGDPPADIDRLIQQSLKKAL